MEIAGRHPATVRIWGDFMVPYGVSKYNRDQWVSYEAIRSVFAYFPRSRIEELRSKIRPYLDFRRDVERFYLHHFQSVCSELCFKNKTSACCGFESIFTFFADHVVNCLVSDEEEIAAILTHLSKPNLTQRCVYLLENGCMLRIRPISCAMFFCQKAKRLVFERNPEAESLLESLKAREKEYTWPDKPVLFDDLEKIFLLLGVETPLFYFHRSPGLLRIKAKRDRAKPKAVKTGAR